MIQRQPTRREQRADDATGDLGDPVQEALQQGDVPLRIARQQSVASDIRHRQVTDTRSSRPFQVR
jgi:hypothetical protein